MKYTFCISLILFILSCQPSTEIDKNQSTEKFQYVEMETTEYDFPKVELPENFRILNISLEDTLTAQFYSIDCLQSELVEMTPFNKAIRNAVMEYAIKQKNYLDTSFYDNSKLDAKYMFCSDMRPIDIFFNENIISIAHLEDSYLEGSNRHNHHWFSFN